MKAIIITDNEPFKDSLERYLKTIFSGIETSRLLVLVDVNTIFDPSQKRQECHGIREAMKYSADKDNVVILLGLENEKTFRMKDPDFGGLMSYANVGFVDILKVHNILPEYQRISGGEKTENKTAIALYEFEKLEKAISGIRHGMNFRESLDSTHIQSKLIEARNAGIKGADEEIVAYLKNWTPETSGVFEGKYLEGIFVDALDTLFDRNWNVIETTKSMVEELAKKMEKEITVISDSDRVDVESALRKHGIIWKYFSKFTLRGATLEMAVDNLSKEEFERSYKITTKHFVTV